ncbi:hypothetical protein AOQ84DRAFT_389217 [Glonium stellatum]|uniref:Uncharacterized protein n=1 Tax=Glonium stellatum TaxID=574774 RepID=A0A8E2F0X7_9PEZI|nr:hypothetical protein AOQ84DRAFT_389217 [Glonium stellatum]
MEVQLAGLDAYIDDIWGKLPTDSVAFKREHINVLEDEFLEDIGKIFARNKVQDRLGLYVNHRHFELQSGERLVEYGAVQTPWQLHNAAADVKARVTPKTWAFFEDKLIPTEFKYATGVEAVQPIHVPAEFLNEFRAYIDAKNLTSRLGISTRSDDAWDPQSMFELTVGRVSIIVPNEQFPEHDVTHVGWFFDADGAKVARDCIRCFAHG